MYTTELCFNLLNRGGVGARVRSARVISTKRVVVGVYDIPHAGGWDCETSASRDPPGIYAMTQGTRASERGTTLARARARAQSGTRGITCPPRPPVGNDHPVIGTGTIRATCPLLPHRHSLPPRPSTRTHPKAWPRLLSSVAVSPASRPHTPSSSAGQTSSCSTSSRTSDLALFPAE